MLHKRLIAFPGRNFPLRDPDRSFNRLVKFRNRLMEAGIVWSQRTAHHFHWLARVYGQSDDTKLALPGSRDANCITVHQVFSILSKCLIIVNSFALSFDELSAVASDALKAHDKNAHVSLRSHPPLTSRNSAAIVHETCIDNVTNVYYVQLACRTPRMLNKRLEERC